jgi:hypothetical protein
MTWRMPRLIRVDGPYPLTRGGPGPILESVMHSIGNHLRHTMKSANAVAPVVSLSSLLLILVLISSISGVQT